MTDGPYSIKNIVREMACEVSYLEDAPDEKLAPFVEELSRIGERLLRLKEFLSNRT